MKTDIKANEKLNHRGVDQRNAALSIIKQFHVIDHIYTDHDAKMHYSDRQFDGPAVVFFCDDDNSYDIRLFDLMAEIPVGKIGMWPVGLVGGLKGPICSDGKLVRFHSGWAPERPFPVDMASFAFHVSLLNENNPTFTCDSEQGMLETDFLQSLGAEKSELYLPLDCKVVWIWHTQTKKILISEKFENQDHSDEKVII